MHNHLLEPNSTCAEMAEELRDVATWLTKGMSPEQARRSVVAFEARKLARYGFTMDSAVTPDGRVLFSLRHADSGELCASMDVNPQTGEVVMQQTCVC